MDSNLRPPYIKFTKARVTKIAVNIEVTMPTASVTAASQAAADRQQDNGDKKRVTA